MNPLDEKLKAGLYFVATPIGNARDITLRALDILGAADVLAAEDTRSLRRLLEIHGIALGARRIIAYHDHSPDKARQTLVEAVLAGQSVAYASEAGMPLVADPGFRLGRAVTEAGGTVTVAPGASAPLAALAISGMATDAFFFAGFLPSARNARKTRLAELAAIPATLVFFESPARLGDMLTDAAQTLGGARDGAICREITKRFEEVLRGSLDDLATRIAAQPVKGEVVVLIGRGRSEKIRKLDLEGALRRALGDMSVKDAADLVSKAHGLPRRDVYQMALRLTGKD